MSFIFVLPGITHADITEFGCIRSLARYLYDTRILPRHGNDSAFQAEDFFSTEHTVDDLHLVAYPELPAAQAEVHSPSPLPPTTKVPRVSSSRYHITACLSESTM